MKQTVPMEGLRETPIDDPSARVGRIESDRIQIFVNKDRTAFLWFCVACVSIVFAVCEPYVLISKLKETERVVIIDPAGTYYLSPLLDFKDAKDFHVQQSTLVVGALLERQPQGFDHPELLKQILLKSAFEKAQRQWLGESAEFKSKQLHQKPEVSKVDVLETREDTVLTQVTGQLVRTGVFEGQPLSEALPFKLALKFKRNPDMSKNGRFPTAVVDFKYESTR
jgi:hypothetical protein